MKTTLSFVSYYGVFRFCISGVSVLLFLADGAVAAKNDDDGGGGQIYRLVEGAQNHFLRRNTVSYCGCPSCTPTIWNTLAGQYSCGARISWLMSGDEGSLSEYDACVRVAGEEFGNGPCGKLFFLKNNRTWCSDFFSHLIVSLHLFISCPHCNPNVCASPPPTQTPTHYEVIGLYCSIFFLQLCSRRF